MVSKCLEEVAEAKKGKKCGDHAVLCRLSNDLQLGKKEEEGYMFESAIIRRHGQGREFVDAGMLAETLLFYGKVHIVADNGLLNELLLKVGANNLLRLMENGFVTLTFLRNNFGVYCEGAFHRFVSIFVCADENGVPFDNERWMLHLFETTLGKSQSTTSLLKRFLNYAVIEENIDVTLNVVGSARSILNDSDFVMRAVTSILTDVVPGFSLPTGWTFSIVDVDEVNFRILTNLKFESINAEYHKTVPATDSTLSPDFLVGYVLHAWADMLLAAEKKSELVTNSITSQIVCLRFEDIVKKRDRSISQFDLFQDVVFRSRSIQERINADLTAFSSFIDVLEKASKFKGWLNAQSPNEDLLTSYVENATADSWVDKLPVKSGRFVATTGLGVILDGLGAGGIASMALSLTDNFLLDRLLKGWRPNQFVNGPLRKFVRP